MVSQKDSRWIANGGQKDSRGIANGGQKIAEGQIQRLQSLERNILNKSVLIPSYYIHNL